MLKTYQLQGKKQLKLTNKITTYNKNWLVALKITKQSSRSFNFLELAGSVPKI